MYTSEILIVILLAWFFVLLATISYITFRKEEQSVQQNLAKHTERIQRANLASTVSWKQKLVALINKLAPIGHKIELLSDPEDLEDSLIKAAYPFNWGVDQLQGAKIVGALAGFAFGFFYTLLGFPSGNIVIILGLLLGYMLPIWTIRVIASRRQKQIRLDLPDFLDMMSITLQAGMSLDSAMQYYVETTKGPLSEELARLNQEIKFGVQRESAYRSLLRRVSSPELEALILSLIQAHNLGTPIAQTFAQQAIEMRKMRSEQAKEAAGKAAPKISLVGGLVIAPSIILLIFGMVIIKNFLSPDGPLRSVLGGL